MARNTQVAADHNAPPVTQILAEVCRHTPVERLERRGGPRSAPNLHELVRLRRGCRAARGGRCRAGRRGDAAAGRPGERAGPQGQGRYGQRRAGQTASPRTPSTSTTRISRPSSTRPARSRPPCWHWRNTAGSSGRDVIDALVIGIDVSCRVGNAMYPDHYDRGWHITGSTGTLGACRCMRATAQAECGTNRDGTRDCCLANRSACANSSAP